MATLIHGHIYGNYWRFMRVYGISIPEDAMKNTIKSITLLFVISMILSACNPVKPVEAIKSELSRDMQPSVGGNDIASIADGNNAFGWDLFRQLQGESGNLFYSPYSISSALGMTWAGARGETAAQMTQVLHFDLDQASLHPAFNGLMLALASRAEAGGIAPGQAFKLNVANALWGQQGFPFLAEFLDTLALACTWSTSRMTRKAHARISMTGSPGKPRRKSRISSPPVPSMR
jgi:serine protease inhibitor